MAIIKFNPKSINDIPKMSQDQIKKLKSMKDKDIDYSDIPDFLADPNFWDNAVLVTKTKKKQISFRVDEDVLEAFKKEGKGYQTKMNQVLKSYLNHKK